MPCFITSHRGSQEGGTGEFFSLCLPGRNPSFSPTSALPSWKPSKGILQLQEGRGGRGHARGPAHSDSHACLLGQPSCWLHPSLRVWEHPQEFRLHRTRGESHSCAPQEGLKMGKEPKTSIPSCKPFMTKSGGDSNLFIYTLSLSFYFLLPPYQAMQHFLLGLSREKVLGGKTQMLTQITKICSASISLFNTVLKPHCV